MGTINKLTGMAKRLRWAWLAALCEGNCVNIMKLLGERHGRVLVGEWPDEAEARTVRDDWKGCNAMHVAVKHGCRELVIKIIIMLGEDEATADVKRKFSISDLSEVLKLPHPLEKLREMILAFDGNCQLDAIGIAVVNGDRKIANDLAVALLHCGCDPYGIGLEGKTLFDSLSSSDIFKLGQEVQNGEDVRMLELIKDVTKGVLANMGGAARGHVEEYFKRHCEFNFSDMNIYLFHALASYRNSVVTTDRPRYELRSVLVFVQPKFGILQKNPLTDCLTECWKKLKDRTDLLNYVFRLKDSRGRTPIHVAVDHDSIHDFLESINSSGLNVDDVLGECLNARDATGRTAMHRAAAAVNVPKSAWRLIERGADVNATFDLKEAGEGWCVDVAKVSKRNGFGAWLPWSPRGTYYVRSIHDIRDRSYPVSAFHLAIFNPRGSGIFPMMERNLQSPKNQMVSLRSLAKYKTFDSIDADAGTIAPAGLAALVGNILLLRILVAKQDARDRWKSGGGKDEDKVVPGVLLAAATADSMAMETFLTSSLFDPTPTRSFSEHLKGVLKAPSTIIEAAVTGWETVTEIKKHIFHIAHSQDGLFKTANCTYDGKIVHRDQYNRRACVNLALQAGASIWNDGGEAPEPSPNTSPEFHAWWSERVEREIQEMKMSLNTASNAISVTAALVATASYVGPLQPPMGYADNHVQTGAFSIKLFMVFDTLAFYVALAAIVLALIPSLPIPSESMKTERLRSREKVVMAITLLMLSVLCILVSFASASIAVISNESSWNHGGLTMSTIAIGGFMCGMAMLSFVKRLRLIKLNPGKYDTLVGSLVFRTIYAPMSKLIWLLPTSWYRAFVKYYLKFGDWIRKHL